MLPFRQKLMKFFTFFFKWKIWLSAIYIELLEKLNLTYRAQNRARLDLGRKFEHQLASYYQK